MHQTIVPHVWLARVGAAMNVRQLHYFLQIAELKSFTRAAAVLHVAQPALSRSMRGLEQELGVQLFHRTDRGVQLTESGELLRSRAAKLVADFAQVRDEVAAQAVELRGELTFGVPPSMREMVTLPLVRAFRARHPGVLLRLNEGISTVLNELVHTGRLDVAVVSATEPLAALAHEPLLTEAMYLIGPRTAGLDPHQEVAIERLAEVPLVVTLRPNALRALVEEALARIGHPLEPVLEANATSVMLDVVAAGDGFTVLPYCAAHAGLAAGRCSAAPVAGLSVTWEIAYSKDRALSRAGHELRSMLREIARQAIDVGAWQRAQLAPTAERPA